jgi:hypothetical protein
MQLSRGRMFDDLARSVLGLHEQDRFGGGWLATWRTMAARVVCAGCLTLVAATTSARGADPVDEPYPLRLVVGQSVALCSTGTLICPAADTRCDDGSVVAIGGDHRGPVLKAVKRGTTVCSTGSASGQGPRRVYRVTVAANPAR